MFFLQCGITQRNYLVLWRIICNRHSVSILSPVFHRIKKYLISHRHDRLYPWKIICRVGPFKFTVSVDLLSGIMPLFFSNSAYLYIHIYIWLIKFQPRVDPEFELLSYFFLAIVQKNCLGMSKLTYENCILSSHWGCNLSLDSKSRVFQI